MPSNISMQKNPNISKNIQEVVINNPRTANEELVWVNIRDAGKKEIEFLRKKYGFELSDLQLASATVSAQRPSLNRGKNYLFLILHFPIYANHHIAASEVDIFVGHGFLVTLHNGNIQSLNEFFNLCKKDGDSLLAYEFESSVILLYELLSKLMKACFPLLDKNSLAINKVQETIFSDQQKKAVSEILYLRNNVINFRKIMQSHKNILTKMMEVKSSLVPHDQLKKYYKELVDESKTIWEILENQKEVIGILNGTNESLLNYRLGEIMRTLTIFSVVVFSLTLTAAIFSMRAIDLPLVRMRGGFVMIMFIMAIVAVSIIGYFKSKKWL
jgi:magnesium transporter